MYMIMSIREIENKCGQCLKNKAEYIVEVTGYFWLWRKSRALCEECCQKWKKHYKFDIE